MDVYVSSKTLRSAIGNNSYQSVGPVVISDSRYRKLIDGTEDGWDFCNFNRKIAD